MPNHGPQFDEFHAQSGEHHGGALYDEHHREVRATPAKDTYGDGRKPTAEPTWDEFPWKAMPEHYGRHFDSNFDEPAAKAGEHGTWHDVFRGARVKAIHCGQPLEATVIRTSGDHAVARTTDGREVELGLFQITDWKRADNAAAPSRKGIKTAHPGKTDAPMKASPAEAPSAHDAKAAGGGERKDLLADYSESVFADKTAPLGEDVIAKAMGDLRRMIED